MRILVTGGAGFIGSNLVRMLVEGGHEVVNLDALTYAGNLENLADLEARPEYRFVRGDIADPTLVRPLVHDVDALINVAAESHVDRSIESAAEFVRTNIVGTEVLLSAWRDRAAPGRFVQVSTDEVYGELEWRDPDLGPGRDRFTERTPLDPRSPYAASKAAADLLALAFSRTLGLDVVVTRCSNNYGPYQFPEKLIPLMVTNALEGEALPVYGDGLNVRDWIHVGDHCRGILAALERGRSGEVYNFGGDAERTNLSVVRGVLSRLALEEELIRFVTDRPGHDRRYAVAWDRAREELGWTPQRTFDEGLDDTVDWYRRNREWWARVREGSYRAYYDATYGSGGRHALGGAPADSGGTAPDGASGGGR